MIEVIKEVAGGGDLVKFSDEILKAIENGATQYSCIISIPKEVGNPYVKLIKLSKVYTRSEILIIEKERLEAELASVNDEISNTR